MDAAMIQMTDAELKWQYSADELKAELDQVCKNHVLKKAYVSLRGYLESLSLQRENYCDLTYLGGSVVLLFDHIAIEICTHGTGLVQYRSLKPWQIKIKQLKDFHYTDVWLISDDHFYDLVENFTLPFENQKVESVLVSKSIYFAFSANDFDKKQAGKNPLLPNNIRFRLENGVEFGIYADEIEYFHLKIRGR